MNLYVFIALIFISASFLACGVIIVSAMMSSRATAKLREKYPSLHHEEEWPQAPEENDPAHRNRSTITQMVTR